MATEIERKFLLNPAHLADEGSDESRWRGAEPVHYCQGYLNRNKARTVRIRIIGKTGFLTVKGPSVGAKRAEFEYPIPLDDAQELLSLCESGVIEKLRRVVNYRGTVWEVDEFLGENTGLIVAEVELEHEDQPIHKPDWVGEEVTHDPRYFNSSLSAKPFKLWS